MKTAAAKELRSRAAAVLACVRKGDEAVISMRNHIFSGIRSEPPHATFIAEGILAVRSSIRQMHLQESKERFSLPKILLN
jgi:antitoxin (DNA-binding transcriptional repressor) of toxin-antitoxin stability system